MMVLLVLSVFVFTIALERFWYLQRCTVSAAAFMKKIRELVAVKAFNEALQVCEDRDRPLARVIKTGLANRHLSRENIEELMVSVRLEEKARMEKFMLFLGSMGAIGPLMGLFGTVIGLSHAFRDLALSGSAGPSVVAAGISEALFATVFGLGIAIPTVLLYNYLSGKIRKVNTEIEVSSKRFLVWLFSNEQEKTSSAA
jgi:biopolymer transport protein ExbB/TolQ